MCAVHRISSEPTWFIAPSVKHTGGLKNEDILYRRALLVWSGIYGIAISWGEFSGWSLNRYWRGAGGESWERTPSVPMMMNVIMETSCGVPFIYLVEQIFPFTLSRSIKGCLVTRKLKMNATEVLVAPPTSNLLVGCSAQLSASTCGLGGTQKYCILSYLEVGWFFTCWDMI